MNNLKNDEYFIGKILTDLHFVTDHMKNITKKELEKNEVLLDSMLFRLIQIHENTKKLSDSYKESRKDIPWRDISGLRNRIVHDYGNVDLEIVYTALTYDIPELIHLFEK